MNGVEGSTEEVSRQLIAERAAAAAAGRTPNTFSAHPAIAVPRDVGDFARSNIDHEWSEPPDARFSVSHRNSVVAGRQRNTKPAFRIGRESCDHVHGVLNDESRVPKWLRIRHSGPRWPRMCRADRNYSFNA
jgi:hypothetical protein